MKRLFVSFLGVFTFFFIPSLAFADDSESDHKKWVDQAFDKIKSSIDEGWSFDLKSRAEKALILSVMTL
jgi:hypothetical protein